MRNWPCMSRPENIGAGCYRSKLDCGMACMRKRLLPSGTIVMQHNISASSYATASEGYISSIQKFPGECAQP